VESYAAAIDLRPDDVIVSWLPLYHDMGLIACLILPAYFGIPVTHLDPFHWIGQPATLFDRIVADRGTLSWLPNFAFEHLAAMLARRADRWDLSGMRAFINCSEPCKPTSFDRFASTFSRSGVRSEQLQCCYAMAETVFAVSQTRIGRRPARLSVDPERLGIGDTVQIVGADSGVALIETGQPISGISVSIHTDAEGELGDGRVGEVRLRGDFLFTGYNRDPELTAARLRDGCYASRDLGFTRDGSLYVLGRMDDLIIVNGRNLFAHEVEAVVNQVAGVKAGRAVALAWFDQRVGSHALVIMAERARGGDRADADIRHDVMTVVHSVFNVAPKAVQLLEEGRLVKTSSGKISRSDNLKRFNAVQQSLKAAEQP
jgi:acyl-CoA synthetase (AMP-forming)/AMP-acid ligase II